MEFGRSGPHGVYVHLHVVEAKEQGQGRAHLLSMGEGHVKDLKHITSLVISLYAQVLSLIHISEPTRPITTSRMPSSA